MWVPYSRAVFARVGENDVNDSRLFMFLISERIIRIQTGSATVLSAHPPKSAESGAPSWWHYHVTDDLELVLASYLLQDSEKHVARMFGSE